LPELPRPAPWSPTAGKRFRPASQPPRRFELDSCC
jgi:hypothetical protein